jgi:hypothetical protein
MLFAVRGAEYLTIPNNPASPELLPNRSSGAPRDAQGRHLGGHVTEVGEFAISWGRPFR